MGDKVWTKARLSDSQGACVEVSIGDEIGVRDSKDPSKVLVFNRREWAAFLDGAKKGEFDI